MRKGGGRRYLDSNTRTSNASFTHTNRCCYYLCLQVVANLLAGVAGAVEAIPGKWKNVMNVSVKVWWTK